MIQRGEMWWAYLTEPIGSGPGYTRPVIAVQDNKFNSSRISTVIIVTVTSNLRLADAPGNVFLERRESGLPKDSVVNVSQFLTVDKFLLTERIGLLSPETIALIDNGLRLVLGL